MTLRDSLRTPGTVFLDHSGGNPADRRHLLFADPIETLRADRPPDVEAVLDRLDRHVQDGRYAAGFVAYEAAGAWVDAGVPFEDDVPLVWFGIYEDVSRPGADEVEALFGELCAGERESPRPRLTIPGADYVRAVQDVRRLIREGDVYQVNYTGRFDARFTGDPLELYGRLRARQPVEYGAFIDCGERYILSLSPELFFRRSGRSIETRPMKGTAPRGRTPEEDRALAAWLRSDPKSLAENLMIVDLLRNDLSVVCETGSVRVPDLYRVESYTTLHQMISRVAGTLRVGAGAADLIRALFPCGSVTGAPKRRAMRRIRELETGPRGVYCGAVGFASPEESVFSVAIRTAVVQGGRLRLGAGSGIVWDSDPQEELEEALLKTAFFGEVGEGSETEPSPRAVAAQRHRTADTVSAAHSGPATAQFCLIETMLVDGRRVRLMDAHMDRLMASARAFGWQLDRGDVEHALERRISGLPDGRHRMRLLAAPSGVRSIETAPMNRDAEPDAGGMEVPLRIALARTEVHSANPFLRHKTTRRSDYDRAVREAAERGLDEVILVNERGEITEGAVNNVFLRMEGRWYTPAPTSGLLEGVARAVFMEAVGAVERPLMASDLRSADEIVLTNAVRGVRRAALVG
ncbi:MAG: aminodeoxychorismate synthase component I [Rhodothermales bacterium]|nr:aminodeoxychorismate synthase component I [Rhodothermales bacterium]